KQEKANKRDLGKNKLGEKKEKEKKKKKKTSFAPIDDHGKNRLNCISSRELGSGRRPSPRILIEDGYRGTAIIQQDPCGP
ncbi:hypothetical protein OFB79_24640, partial [Escherichia coli]|nr:hypothetical protein [Escherichia coli]